MDEKILPLCNKPPIMYFLHHALPLAIILAEDKNKNFALGNYIQMYKSEVDQYLFEMYPRIGSAEKYGEYPMDHVLMNQIITKDVCDLNADEVIDAIIKWIDLGYYVQVLLDERYLKGVRNYGSSTFFKHQCLFYGYDRDKKIMKMLNFTPSQTFKMLEISFEDIKTSFNSQELKSYANSVGYNDFIIQLRKVNQKVIDYNYTDEKTIAKIKLGILDYINCVDSAKRNYLAFDCLDHCEWGIIVYDYIYKCFNMKYSTKYVMQCACGLDEHKQLMKERMIFLQDKGYDIPKKLLDKMDEIILQVQIMRNVVLKWIVRKDDCVKEVLAMVYQVRDQEVDVLSQLLNIIR